MRFAAEGYDDLWAPIVTSARPAAVAAVVGAGRHVARAARWWAWRASACRSRPRASSSRRCLRTGVYLTAGLLLLGALAALLIARRISIRSWRSRAAPTRSAPATWTSTIDVPLQDELGLLADSFNRMAAQLRETMSKLESLNRNLESEVSRRTDEIRRSAEFTEVLNAPIEPATRARARTPS